MVLGLAIQCCNSVQAAHEVSIYLQSTTNAYAGNESVHHEAASGLLQLLQQAGRQALAQCKVLGNKYSCMDIPTAAKQHLGSESAFGEDC
jgi:hypothetical protein